MIFSGTFFLSTKSVFFLCAYSVLLSAERFPSLSKMQPGVQWKSGSEDDGGSEGLE